MLAAVALALALAAPAASVAPPDPLDPPPPPLETFDPAAPPPGLPPDVDDPPAPPKRPAPAPAFEEPPPDDDRPPMDATTLGIAMFGLGAAMNCASLSCFVLGPAAYVAPCLYCVAFPAGIGAAMTWMGNTLGQRQAGYAWPMGTMMAGNAATIMVSAGLVVIGAFASGLLVPTIPQNPVVLFGFGAAGGATMLVGTVASAGAAALAYHLTSAQEPSAPNDADASPAAPAPVEVRRAAAPKVRTAMAF